MFVRNRHVVVFGAQRVFGRRLIEALLALGAHVVAVAPLRTELEALRAELRQHHHLHVAECSGDVDGPRRLIEATLRSGHADAIVFVADESAESLAEGASLARALSSLQAAASPPTLFARPAPSAEGHPAGPGDRDTRLAAEAPTRELRGALLYDPQDLGPAVNQMLTLLSPPPVT